MPLEITTKKVANAIVKIGIRRARARVRREHPNAPVWVMQVVVRVRGIRAFVPDKFANALEHSDYPESEFISIVLDGL